jgi:hypothetical protein
MLKKRCKIPAYTPAFFIKNLIFNKNFNFLKSEVRQKPYKNIFVGFWRKPVFWSGFLLSFFSFFKTSLKLHKTSVFPKTTWKNE